MTPLYDESRNTKPSSNPQHQDSNCVFMQHIGLLQKAPLQVQTACVWGGVGEGIYIQMLGGLNIILNGPVYHGVMLHRYKGHDRDENIL